MTLLNPEIPRVTSSEQVRAVVFDWAGTTVDHGSLAPVRTLERVFAEAEVAITEAEARRDMGIAKRDHIAGLLRMPRVAEAWKDRYGKLPDEADGDALYDKFIPLQFACLKEYSTLIPGVTEVVQMLRSRGIKLGSCTGYTRAMLDVLVAQAGLAGYRADCNLSPEDVGAGRPHPFMIFSAAIQLQVYPLATIVKVGDTESDIQEGLNAGVWSVGVAGTGNGIQLSREDFWALTPEARNSRVTAARDQLQQAGAHYVIDSLADVGSVIDDVNHRLSRTLTA